MSLGLVMSEKQILKVRGAFRAVVTLALLVLCVAGFRLVAAKMRVADQADRIQMQRNTLKNLRDSLKGRPATSVAPKRAYMNPVAQLQTDLQRSAALAHCTVSDFQASTDYSPYLSVFTLDTNHPNWQQVSIHVTFRGSLASTLATVESLGKSTVPIEPDSLEITRQSISQDGASEVLLRLDFRALVLAGGRP